MFSSSKFRSKDTNGNLRIYRCQSTIQVCIMTSIRLIKVSFPTNNFFLEKPVISVANMPKKGVS
jgi:hypothetical protein